jgi:M6 family metalloprotease-like protein
MRKIYEVLGILGLGLLMWTSTAMAVPANPDPLLLQQPDGSTFWARLWGDEWLNGTETADGYTILKDAAGRWVYARRSATGELEPSQLVVGRDSPVGIPKHLRPKAPPGGFIPLGAPNRPMPGVQPAPPTAGSHYLLAIVVDFTPSQSLGTTEDDWYQHFFGLPGGSPYTPAGSVKTFWDTVSYGTITIQPAPESYGTTNNGIVFVTLSSAHPNCQGGGASIGDCNRQLTRDALVAADSFVNFASFDTNPADGYINTNELMIYIVVRGYERSFGGSSTCTDRGQVWAHRWSLGFGSVSAPTLDGVVVAHWRGAPTSGPRQGGYMQQGEYHCATPFHTPGHIATIGGAAVHEIGHDLGTGMPDLYDTDNTIGTASYGIGDWGVQGLGAWNGYNLSGHSGTHPAWPEAYSRWWFGFLTPTAITGPTIGVSLPQIETATGPNRGVYVIPGGIYTHWDDCVGGTGEYWLVENRQLVGFDAGLDGSGLLIWHIYENLNTCRPNADEGTSPPGNPRLVVLEQADGNFGLECYSGSPGSPTCNDGDSTDPWYAGNATTFDDTTTPNSKFYSGTSSGVCITNISASGATMTADMGVSGCPTTVMRTLTVTGAGTGNGTVSGPGISCTITAGSTSGDCSESYPAGTSVTLTATAASGSTFAGWTNCDASSGNQCTVTMNANRTVTASFTTAPWLSGSSRVILAWCWG